MAEGNEAHTWLGSQGRVKRLFSTWWCREAEVNVPQQVFEKPGWGKVNPCQKLSGSRRLRETRHSETTLLYMLVLWSWGKRTPTNFWETRLRESKPCQNLFGSRRPRETRHILGWALKAEWNDSSVHVGAVKLREMNPTSFWETRLSESKPRSNFVWFT